MAEARDLTAVIEPPEVNFVLLVDAAARRRHDASQGDHADHERSLSEYGVDREDLDVQARQ